VLLSEPNKATAHPAAAAAAAPIANATLLDRGREWTREWRTEMRGILNDPNQQALIAYACIQPLRFSCFATATVLHLTDVIDAGPQQIGIMFTLMALGQGLSTPIGATLADRMKPGTARTALVVPALFGSQVVFASLAFASDPTAVYTAVLLQGVATGIVASAVGAFSAEVTPQATRGQAMSLQRQAGSSLALFSPIALGLLADCTSRPVAIVATSSVMAACTFGYMYLATKAERAAEEDEKAANRERGA
jgi:MFS family permease